MANPSQNETFGPGARLFPATQFPTPNLSVPDPAAAANWYEKYFGGRRLAEGPGRLMFGSSHRKKSVIDLSWTLKRDARSNSPRIRLSPPSSSQSGSYQVIVADTVTLTGSVAINSNLPNARSPLEPPVSVTVSPTSAPVYPGKTQQFTAAIGNSSQGVTWTVNPATGTINANGLYTAPATITSQQTVTVTATSQEDPTKSAAASLTLSPPISVTVMPPTVTLYGGQTQQFAATVNYASNTAVTWTVMPSSGAGTLTTGGLYTAPATIPAFQPVTVTATSVADTTQTAAAVVLLAPVTVYVSPGSISLTNGAAQQFTATVTGSSNGSVTWSRSPSVGTLTPGGLYTAPASIAASQAIGITAFSVADPAQTGTATVNLISSGQITSVSPATARAGETVTGTVVGQGTSFGRGSIQLSLGVGVTIGSIAVTDVQNLTATLVIDRAASPGARDLVVTGGGVPITLSGAFTVAAPLPLITIAAPTPQTFTNVSPATVRETVSDPSAAVTVNGVAASNSGGSFLATVPLVEGNNELVITAQSQAGVATSSVLVTLDTTPPRVAITSPAPGLVTTVPSITVTESINDIVVGTVNPQQARVTVNGTQATVSNRAIIALSIPLNPGSNTIQATGTDSSGNSASTSITVTRVAQTQPEIRAVSGANQSGTISTALSAPLVVTLVDAVGLPQPGKPVLFKVKQSNGSLSAAGATTQFQTGSIVASLVVPTNAQGQASANGTLGSRAGAGNNRVEATSAGFTGTAVFAASAAPSAATQINVDTGNEQQGAVNSPLAFPFVVVVSDAGHNRLANVPVTFTVTSGGGNLGGQTTVTQNTDSDGRALVTLTLGGQAGIENNFVTATFAGNTTLPAVFRASALAPGDPAQTTISGVVLDNANTPIQGVTMRLYQPSLGSANNVPQPVGSPVQTTAQGQFLMTGVPVGRFKLIADPSTTTRPGSWPTLEYDIVTVAGQNTTIGMPVYLLPLNTANQLCVTATTGGMLTLPNLPGFSLTLQPGSVTFPGGAQSGCVSVTQVHMDKVPMAPAFGRQPRLPVTIQPVGAVFNPPAAITVPNVEGLKPREVTEFFSFDHDLNAFVSIGTATVSDDGQVIASDPGIGVQKAGWEFGAFPRLPGGAQDAAVILDRPVAIVPVGSSGTVTAAGTPLPGSAPPYARSLTQSASASFAVNGDGSSITIVSNDFSGDDVPGDPPYQVTYFAQSGASATTSGVVCQPNKSKFVESSSGPGLPGCRGFDPTTSIPTLMVPAQGSANSVTGNTNKAQAQLRRKGPNQCGWDIFHFGTSDPAQLGVAPTIAAQQEQEVTVPSLAASATSLNAFAHPADDQSNHLAELNVDVKKERPEKYYYYVVGSIDKNGKVTVPAGAPTGPAIAQKLRDIWTRQANVRVR